VSEKLAISRVARALDGLYGSGMTLAEAIPVAADACGNELVRRRVRRMAPMMAGGMPLSEAMRAVGGFPAAFVNMIATGEEGGQLSQMLANAADYYENEAETTLKRMAIVLPIIIYIFVAAYIGYGIINFYRTLFKDRYEGLDTLLR
jgi:type II secretory pathway component PulF